MKSLLIIFLFFLIPTLSFSKIHSPGLLTDDYGIVTKQDIDENEKECTEVEPFPKYGKTVGCNVVIIKDEPGSKPAKKLNRRNHRASSDKHE